MRLLITLKPRHPTLTSHLPQPTKLHFLVVLEAAKTMFRTTSRYYAFDKVVKQDSNRSQYGGNVAEATIEIRMQFVRKVYAIL